jgi:hypothetical protein
MVDIVSELDKLGPVKGFARESFRPIYLRYRLGSTVAAHANLNLYDAYFTSSHFMATTAIPEEPSITDGEWCTALYSTAYLASKVLDDTDCKTPVADALIEWLAPDPTGRSSWTPGI